MDALTTQRKLNLLAAKPPHMQPLGKYLTYLRKRRPGKNFPLFDPEDAGAQAELLLLLSYVEGDPMRENGSPFISTENDDLTAGNFREVLGKIGLKRSAYVVWNVVPWLGGDPGKDAEMGAMLRPELVKALPNLRGIMVLSMEDGQLRAVKKELKYVSPKVEVRSTSNPGHQSYVHRVHRAESLTAALRDFAYRLNLIP